MICNLCRSDNASRFQTFDEKIYWKCSSCGCKYLDTAHLINPQEEKKRYLEHNNDIHDKKYRSFLSKLSEPLKE